MPPWSLAGRRRGPHRFTTDVLAHLLGGDGSERSLRVAAAELRIALSRHPDDAYLRALLAGLTATSQSFRDRWEEGEVSASRSAIKQMHHPTYGWTRFEIEVLHDPERDHWIMLDTPHDDESSALRAGQAGGPAHVSPGGRGAPIETGRAPGGRLALTQAFVSCRSPGVTRLTVPPLHTAGARTPPVPGQRSV
ncbi:hypothetical protein ACFWTE_04935 [Nocardiopsis sp. NPDC058631]|uniref:MmyB family transcriptional regulator n=1 Tax=Nocardiopsis sp. NPDC058631 TaxID=3346566 RepID=UPI003658B90E